MEKLRREIKTQRTTIFKFLVLSKQNTKTPKIPTNNKAEKGAGRYVGETQEEEEERKWCWRNKKPS